MTLILWHDGDMSTGIQGEQTEIETCIPRACWEHESMEWFRNKMVDVFSEIWDFKTHAVYDFEFEELENDDINMHKIMEGDNDSRNT